MTSKEKGYFAKELLVLKIMGVSLKENERLAYKVYSITIFSALMLYFFLNIFEMSRQNLDVVAGFVIYPIGAIMATCKAVTLMLNRDKFKMVLEKMQQEPFLPDPARGGDKEEILIKECLWITSVETFTYWICAASYNMAMTTLFIYKRLQSSDFNDWQTPYGPLTVFNITYSPNFELFSAYQCASVFFSSTIFTSVDLLLAAVLAHISYQFKLAQNYFTNIVRTNYDEHDAIIKKDKLYNTYAELEIIGSLTSVEKLNKTLKKAVKYHIAILDAAKELEEVFNKVLLLAFLTTLILLCFSIYNGSKVTNGGQLIKHIGEAVCSILQVLLICHWGERVTHESHEVSTAVCNADFVGTDRSFQKSLAFVVRRSQYPTRLTAGKFADISIITFAWILRTSYSAFMVLRQSRVKDDRKM